MPHSTRVVDVSQVGGVVKVDNINKVDGVDGLDGAEGVGVSHSKRLYGLGGLGVPCYP